MQNTKLLDLLRLLPAKDRRRFREYVYSPIVNKNRKVRRLCEVVLRYAPGFDHPDLAKEHVYPRVFGEPDYDELRLNNVISDLLHLLYDYLAFTEFEAQAPRRRQLALAGLLEREINHHVERQARRYQQLQIHEPAQSYEHFLDEHLFYDLLDRHSLTRGRRGYDENLQCKNDALDRYYLCNKLRIACDMASRNVVVNAGYQCHYLDDLLDRYRTAGDDLRALPALRVYYTTYRLLTGDDNEPTYRELRDLLDRHEACFPPRELHILYRYVLNHCVRHINFGHSQYYREIFDIYRLLLDRRIIFENGYLTQWSYMNIITTGIRLGEYEWTEQFIHTCREFLLPAERQNVYTYNLAAFYFEKRDYQRALQQLQDVEFTDTSFHLGAKIIQIKSFFELDETEAFFSLLEAFRRYVRRNREISDYRKRANLNFLRLAHQIYQLRLDAPALPAAARAKRRQAIVGQLRQLSPVANKEWLEEVFGMLGAGNGASSISPPRGSGVSNERDSAD